MAAALAVLYAVTVVPFLVTVDLAERRGCSTGRWAGLSLAAVLVAVWEFDLDQGQACVCSRGCLGPRGTGLRDGVDRVHDDGVAQLEVGDGELVEDGVALRCDRHAGASQCSLGGIDA